MHKAVIVDVKFRCEVWYLMSDSVSEMPIFGGFWVIFLWGWRFTNFWGAISNYTKTGYCVKV